MDHSLPASCPATESVGKCEMAWMILGIIGDFRVDSDCCGRAVRSSLPTGRSTRADGEAHPVHWRSNVSPRPRAAGWSRQRAGQEEDND